MNEQAAHASAYKRDDLVTAIRNETIHDAIDILRARSYPYRIADTIELLISSVRTQHRLAGATS